MRHTILPSIHASFAGILAKSVDWLEVRDYACYVFLPTTPRGILMVSFPRICKQFRNQQKRFVQGTFTHTAHNDPLAFSLPHYILVPFEPFSMSYDPVSYTHLTLPTKA